MTRLDELKTRLDELRPVKGAALDQLQSHFDVELTYTSNAIEGNTLTRQETAELIEHGFTVGGKTLRDHLEAVDHYDALQWMREQAARTAPLGENTVTELHRRIVLRSQPAIAGFYSNLPRRIVGSQFVLPSPAKLPFLMDQFGTWLSSATGAAASFEAHRRLVAIHPFADGNGRTARLLMNLMLLRDGYPPVAVRPEDRPAYISALERAHMTGDDQPFQQLMHNRLEATLDEYVALLEEAL